MVEALTRYRSVVRHPTLRRLLPGVLVSALGDGMSIVAIAWLAVQLAPVAQRGVWTGLAVAAYALPGTLGAAVLGPLVRNLGAARLVAADAVLRAALLGAVPVLYAVGHLSPAGYVALLAGSSLLHAWGGAGTYTLVAEALPERDRITGNALLATCAQAATIVGPALAGGLTALAGPAAVIGVDALSFAVLAATCLWLARTLPSPVRQPERTGALRTILARPSLLALIAVTCLFYVLYGPVEVALPVHVADELHASASVLGLYFVVFGAGAAVGGLCAGLLQNRPLWLVIGAVVTGWGLALLPSGLTDALVPGLVGFGVGGVVYGPFSALSNGLMQQTSPPGSLSRVLAVRNALVVPSASLGTALGGPLVGAVGGRQTLLASSVATIALGVALLAAALLRRRTG
ncbi:MFS transporter [Actinocatenispora rupis]|uniref:Putative multidrug-efflux transporter n=1 Tax=Actinocatenispora rupis TaxID=519421 RepID=A0A8J3J7E2_9ACTN|nr:MFS transporter [Actinocatenispora rupis]GID15458.1 putative multidrug-efflux transporter [Actinocatenispora rupis]